MHFTVTKKAQDTYDVLIRHTVIKRYLCSNVCYNSSDLGNSGLFPLQQAAAPLSPLTITLCSTILTKRICNLLSHTELEMRVINTRRLSINFNVMGSRGEMRVNFGLVGHNNKDLPCLLARASPVSLATARAARVLGRGLNLFSFPIGLTFGGRDGDWEEGNSGWCLCTRVGLSVSARADAFRYQSDRRDMYSCAWGFEDIQRQI